MKTLIASLKLSHNTSARTRERCPDVLFELDGEVVASIRTDTERPSLPFDDGEIDLIEIRDDAISRVIDEATWLAEIGRVLATGGGLRLTLPAAGALAWLDTMNIYRYMVDIGKRGDEPNASLPTGWNRHYPQADARSLLRDAGFERIKLQSANYADREIGLLATLFWRNWIKGAQSVELEVYPRYGSRIPGARRFPIPTTWSITAVKQRKPAEPPSEPEPSPRPADPSE